MIIPLGRIPLTLQTGGSDSNLERLRARFEDAGLVAPSPEA